MTYGSNVLSQPQLFPPLLYSLNLYSIVLSLSHGYLICPSDLPSFSLLFFCLNLYSFVLSLSHNYLLYPSDLPFSSLISSQHLLSCTLTPLLLFCHSLYALLFTQSQLYTITLSQLYSLSIQPTLLFSSLFLSYL